MKLNEEDQQHIEDHYAVGKEFCARLAREIGNKGRELKISEISSDEPTLDEAKVRDVFREMESRGYGKLILGRRSHPTRFSFSGKHREGAAVRERTRKSLPHEEPEVSEEKLTKQQPPATTTQYPFPIRNGLSVMLELPTDLKKSEAERLSAFVSALAFADET